MEKKKRPEDIAQLAYQIVQEATRGPQESLQALAKEKNPAAVALGHLGGTCKSQKTFVKETEGDS
jgi:hypothetical protein